MFKLDSKGVDMEGSVKRKYAEVEGLEDLMGSDNRHIEETFKICQWYRVLTENRKLLFQIFKTAQFQFKALGCYQGYRCLKHRRKESYWSQCCKLIKVFKVFSMSARM